MHSLEATLSKLKEANGPERELLTGEEHKTQLEFVKERALGELQAGGSAPAMASILSDLAKYPLYSTTQMSMLQVMGMQASLQGDMQMERFITGMN